jgi:hypothetical protein
MRLKMEFGMKEMLYKNKIQKMQEAHEKKLLELTEMHESQARDWEKKLDEINCEHSRKVKDLNKDGT